MLAVLLTILKIIGIIVLSVVALVLLLVAIVLFVPVRYGIDTDKSQNSDDFYANVNVSFLLHILSATVRYEEELYKSVKVFGIKVWPRRIKEKKSEKTEDFTIDWNEDEAYIEAAESGKTSEDEECSGKDLSDEDLSCEEQTDKDLFKKLENFIDNIVSRFESLSEKYDKIKKEYRFWDKMINDTRNRNAALIIKNQFIRLLRAIRPRKIKGYIHFGFEDPATCGRVLMYLSIIYPTLPRKLVLDPSFEDTDIYGNVVIKGRIFLVVFVVCLIKLYFNKDIKRMYRLYKKHQSR